MKDPVDVILIIGQFNRLPPKLLKIKKLKLIIAIFLAHQSRSRKMLKIYLKLKRMIHPDFERTQHYLFHDACGGVTNGRFWIDILSRKNSGFNWSPPGSVSGVLGNSLDHKQGEERVPLPIQVQLNTSRLILC